MKYSWGWWICHAKIDDVDDYEWCEKTFGQSKTSNWFYQQASNDFYFKKKEHAIWFELRWI